MVIKIIVIIIILPLPLLKIYSKFFDHGKTFCRLEGNSFKTEKVLWELRGIFMKWFFNNFLNVSGALFLLNLYMKARCW